MKKFIFALAVVTLFAGAQFANAEMTVVPSSHPVYGGKDGTEIVGYISNIDWDAAQLAVQARNGQKLPIVLADQTVTDEAGVIYNCSNAGTSRHNCVSLVNTPAYRANMLSIAKSIIAAGQQTAFPRFSGWFKLVK